MFSVCSGRAGTGGFLATAVFLVPPSTKKQLSLDCVQRPPKYVLHTPPPWMSPPADQSPGKDSEAWVPDSEERLILREEFTSRMHQRFLDGKDGDFDYRCSSAPASLFPSPAPHRPQGFRSTTDQRVTLD